MHLQAYELSRGMGTPDKLPTSPGLSRLDGPGIRMDLQAKQRMGRNVGRIDTDCEMRDSILYENDRDVRNGNTTTSTRRTQENMNEHEQPYTHHGHDPHQGRAKSSPLGETHNSSIGAAVRSLTDFTRCELSLNMITAVNHWWIVHNDCQGVLQSMENTMPGKPKYCLRAILGIPMLEMRLR